MYTREVKHYNMIVVKMSVQFHFFFTEAIYRIDCLLAHSVIDINGGRPKAALVGLRLTCPWPKATLADERLLVAHSFFQGPWPMV